MYSWPTGGHSTTAPPPPAAGEGGSPNIGDSSGPNHTEVGGREDSGPGDKPSPTVSVARRSDDIERSDVVTHEITHLTCVRRPEFRPGRCCPEPLLGPNSIGVRRAYPFGT